MKRSLLLLVLIGGLLNACGGSGGGGLAPHIATQFFVSAPAAAKAGTAFTFSISAIDDVGDAANGYSGTVRFTSTDPKAVLPGSTTIVGGTGTFSATLETVGPQTITVTDMVKTMITGTSSSIINSLGGLLITSGPPPPGTVGVPYGTPQGCSYRVAHTVFELKVVGGKPPYSWGGSSQAPGLNVTYQSFAGLPPLCQSFTIPVIEGTPTAAGSYNVTVTVTDSGSPAGHASANYTIIIGAAQAVAKASAAFSSASEPNSEKAHAKHHMYKLIDLGTFGGPNSFINCCAGVEPNLNKRGVVVGGADTSIPNPHGVNPNPLLCCEIFVNPAFKWQDGDLIELAALPGGFNGFAVSINASGAVIGTAENGETDPLQGYPESHPVLWKDDKVIDLGTFGGYEGLALAINKSGQVAGFAQNAISDPFGYFGFGTQSRAFLWQDGLLQDLGTLGGNDANSDYLNDQGQVAGASYTNTIPNPITGLPTQAPFLWENGRMLNLGTLGGNSGVPNGLNNQGQVVGQSNLSGDLVFHPFFWDEGILKDLGTFGGPSGSANGINDAGQVVGYGDLPGPPCLGYSCVHHAFLWDHGIMTDLGTLPTEICSNAVSINQRGEIMGYSTPFCNSETFHPFIWENGNMYDLRALIVPGSDITLGEFSTLNDRGEMAGVGTLPNGDLHSVLLIPCDAEHEDVEGCDYKLVDAAAASNKATAFTQSTRATASEVANPITRKEAMRARFAYRHR
jgi:probable HAF family extracellular repeat protein